MGRLGRSVVALAGTMQLALASCQAPAGASDKSELAFLESRTGANFCATQDLESGLVALGFGEHNSKNIDPKKSENIRNEMRQRVVSTFDTIENDCLSFIGADPFLLPGTKSRKIIKNSGFITLDKRRIPVIVSRPEKIDIGSIAEDSTFFIRVNGGPGLAELFSPSDELIPYFGNVIVLDIFYTGNGFNILHPLPSYGLAVDQIAHLVEMVRSRNPNSTVVLLGESLGARLAVNALQLLEAKLAQPQIDKLILLSPPFANLQETGILLQKMQERACQALVCRFPYRVRSKDGSYNDYGLVQEFDGIDVYKAFAEHDFTELDLAEDLSNLKSPVQTIIIYGSEDERISPDLAKKFAVSDRHNIGIFEVEGMEHQFSNSQQSKRIFDEIDKFVF